MENVNIEEAVSATGHGRYHHILLITCCIINIGAVMDMLGYSLVVPAASCDLDLTLEEGGILKSISFAGFLFALPWGYAADTIGRKRTILVSISAGFIFSSMTSFSNSYKMMLVLKFLASSFSSASMALITTYLGESTCKKKRTRYIFIQNVSSTGSDFLSFVLAYLVLPLKLAVPVPFLTTYKSWRLFSLLMSLPLGVGAVMMCFLKESPKFLANTGDTDKAIDVLTAIFKANYGNSGIYPVKSLMKSNKDVETVSFWNSVVKHTTPIFKPPLLWRLLQLTLLLSICCSTNNVFFMWFPTMVNSFYTSSVEDSSFCQNVVANITPIIQNDLCIDNNSMETIYAGMLFTLLFSVLNIGALVFADWRRTLIFAFCLIASVSCIFVNEVSDRILIMILFCMIQFTGLAIGSVYSYYVDLFPTSYRGFATGLGTMVTRSVCLGGVAIVGTTVIDYCHLTFYCWAVFLLSGIVAALFLPKDAKQTNTDFS